MSADIAAAEDARPEWLEAMSVLSLQPGDVVVVRANGLLSNATFHRLRTLFAEHFPGHKILVLEDGTAIGVVRAASHGGGI